MAKTRISAITVISSVVLLLHISGIVVGVASASAICVEPSHVIVSSGDTFTVNLTVAPEGTEVYGAQYVLYFDNRLLRAQCQNKGPFLGQDGVGTIIIINRCDNTHCKTEYAEARAGVSYGVNNRSVLATIDFEVIGDSGTCELHLDEVILVDPDANKISNVTINNGLVEIAEEHAKPDLVIIDKWVNSDNCTICYNVTNTGNGTASVGHNTSLFVDGVEMARDYVQKELAPGEKYTGRFDSYNWTYTQPEDIITVCADFNNTVDESNETNNCLNETWKCGDVDMDGTVDFLGDAISVARHYMYGDPIRCEWAGDIDCSGDIDFLGDAIKIARHYMYGVQLECCCE